MAGGGSAQERLDQDRHASIAAEHGGRGLLGLRHAPRRGAGAVRHQGPEARGGAQDAAAGRRGPGRRHRRPRAAAGPGRRAVPSQFRLPPGDRRGDLPLADGRADPARRPRARRAGRAEPHAPRNYTDEEIETLETVAMVLAELVAERRTGGARRAAEPTEGIGLLPMRLEGTPLNAGLAIGQARAARAAHPAEADGGRGSAPGAWSACARRSPACRAALDDMLASPDRGRRRRASRHPRDLPHVRRGSRLARPHRRDRSTAASPPRRRCRRCKDDMRGRMEQVVDPYLRERIHRSRGSRPTG